MGVQRPPLTALWVDLGLPSGNRWAVSNLDATGPYYFQETPFQYECSFFSWGNVTPHNPISETAFDYNFGSINSAEPWYEGQPYGDTPGSKLTGDIQLTNDAARIMLGAPWRMPSMADFDELLAYVIFIDADGQEIDSSKTDKRVSVNEVTGIYIQSRINGARMFLPSCGNGDGRRWYWRSSIGIYWDLRYDSDRYARNLYFYSTGISSRNRSSRCLGCPIRPIWNPKDLRG